MLTPMPATGAGARRGSERPRSAKACGPSAGAIGSSGEAKEQEKSGREKENETEEQYRKRSEPRASSTDAEARVMKMADGGFRPAYNVQLASTPGSQIIVGVEVNNSGSDGGQLSSMLEQVHQRYQQRPLSGSRRWLCQRCGHRRCPQRWHHRLCFGAPPERLQA